MGGGLTGGSWEVGNGGKSQREWSCGWVGQACGAQKPFIGLQPLVARRGLGWGWEQGLGRGPRGSAQPILSKKAGGNRWWTREGVAELSTWPMNPLPCWGRRTGVGRLFLPECNHCTRPTAERQWAYQSGELLPPANAAFAFCRRKGLSVVQSLSPVWLFGSPWTAAHQASLSFTISQSLLKHMSFELVMLSKCLILCLHAPHPFSSCPQSFPASGSFPVSQFFVSGGQSIGPSASVFPLNIQSWFPLGLIGLNFLPSKGLSKNLLQLWFESIISLALNLLYGPTVTSVHDYWKNHSFDYTNFCLQSDVSAF